MVLRFIVIVPHPITTTLTRYSPAQKGQKKTAFLFTLRPCSTHSRTQLTHPQQAEKALTIHTYIDSFMVWNGMAWHVYILRSTKNQIPPEAHLPSEQQRTPNLLPFVKVHEVSSYLPYPQTSEKAPFQIARVL